MTYWVCIYRHGSHLESAWAQTYRWYYSQTNSGTVQKAALGRYWDLKVHKYHRISDSLTYNKNQLSYYTRIISISDCVTFTLILKNVSCFHDNEPSGIVLPSNAGGPGFNPQSRTLSFQRHYKNSTSSSLNIEKGKYCLYLKNWEK